MAFFCFTLLRPESGNFTKERHHFFCVPLYYYSPISEPKFRSELRTFDFSKQYLDSSSYLLFLCEKINPLLLGEKYNPRACRKSVCISQL